MTEQVPEIIEARFTFYVLFVMYKMMMNKAFYSSWTSLSSARKPLLW